MDNVKDTCEQCSHEQIHRTPQTRRRDQKGFIFWRNYIRNVTARPSALSPCACCTAFLGAIRPNCARADPTPLPARAPCFGSTESSYFMCFSFYVLPPCMRFPVFWLSSRSKESPANKKRKHPVLGWKPAHPVSKQPSLDS